MDRGNTQNEGRCWLLTASGCRRALTAVFALHQLSTDTTTPCSGSPEHRLRPAAIGTTPHFGNVSPCLSLSPSRARGFPSFFPLARATKKKGGGESGRESPPSYVSCIPEKPFAAEKLRARAPVHPFPAFIRRWGERRVARVLRARASFPPGRLSRHTYGSTRAPRCDSCRAHGWAVWAVWTTLIRPRCSAKDGGRDSQTDRDGERAHENAQTVP